MRICKTRKLTAKQIKEIITLYPSIGVEAIARRFNTSNRTVCDVLRYRTYRDIKRDPVVIAPPFLPVPMATQEAVVTLHKLDKRKYSGLHLAKVFNVHFNTVYKILRKNRF
jgi:hypothetical protein